MKKLLIKTTILAALAICSIVARAQDKAVVKGAINDNKGMALHAATIYLLKAADSSFVKAGIADEKGNYVIDAAAAGNYLLSWSAIGFETTFSQPFELKAGQLHQLQPVQLQPATKQLQGVTVTASKKPLMQVKPDKLVFNVSSSISAAGSNGLELLQKMPGIQVDDKGNVIMKGRKGVKIYVDGRMTQITSEDLVAYLKSINSNDIDAIEIISAPGAQYDASGNAGVINIRLKKNSSMGMNGSISAGLVQGITPKGNAAANVNYRNQKWNLFSNASFNTGKNQMDITAPRLQKGIHYDQALTIVSDTRNYSIKAGADYFIDQQQTIGLIVTGNLSQDDWLSNSQTDIYQPGGDITTLVASNNQPRKRTNFNTNLNYRFADSSGRLFNVDIDYGRFYGRGHSYQPNYYFQKGEQLSTITTLNNMPTNIEIYTAKTDATLPLAKGSLGFGAKIAYVVTDNTSSFYNVNGHEQIAMFDRSFHFRYTENVNAAYVSYQRQLNAKWSLQAGVRAEQTNSKGLLTRADGVVQADNDVKRSYLDFFPNANITFVANKQNTLNVSFTRRIDRPVYQDLNPFELKLDELTSLKGNSFLRPQYTNTVALSHTWKNTITTSLEYSHVKDYAAEITDTLGNTTFAQQRNVATQDIIGLNISAPVQFTPKWKAFVMAWGNHQSFVGRSGNNSIDVQLFTYGASMQHTITLGNNYSAEATGWFNGPGLYGPTFRTKAMGSLDLGAQKLVLNGKGTIRIGATDVLRTSSIWRARNEFGGLLFNIRAAMENRTFRVGFTYRFGNNNVKASRERQTGLEAENSRIKTK